MPIWPSRHCRRRSYALLQELLSGLQFSYEDNVQLLIRKACELSGCLASIYARANPSDPSASFLVAAVCQIDASLVGAPIPVNCGDELKAWCRERLGMESLLCLPVLHSGSTIGQLVVLQQEQRRVSTEQYDALELLCLAFSFIERRCDAVESLMRSSRFKNILFSASPTLSKEQRIDRVLHELCSQLADGYGFVYAMIGLVDGQTEPDGQLFHAGTSDAVSGYVRHLKESGRMAECGVLAMGQAGGMAMSELPCGQMRSCPLAREDDGNVCMSLPIAFGKQSYGWLSVVVSRPYQADAILTVILTDLTESIGIFLQMLSLEQKRREEEEIKNAALKEYEKLEAFRLKQIKVMQHATVRELLRMTIDEAEERTGSSVGFFHFIDQAHAHISMQGWSTNTIEGMCRMKVVTGHYLMANAGLWADAARQRRVVVYNDYPEFDGKNGLPEGHAPIKRVLLVPIMRNGEVKAIVGLGNKPTEYVEEDIQKAQALADQSWDLIENKRFLEHEELLMNQLQHSKKMELIGTMTAGITHEINNPLAVLGINVSNLSHSFTDLADLVGTYRKVMEACAGRQELAELLTTVRQQEQEIELDAVMADLPDLLEALKNGVERIAGITRSMRSMAFKNVSDAKVESSLNRVVQEATAAASIESAPAVLITTELGELRPVTCNVSQIHQVILNLLLNSIHAIKALKRDTPGSVVVRTWAEGREVYCSVQDDGPGIDESIRHEIFTPFFTTKERGIGTGLGLSISYDIIVAKHGGTFAFDCPPAGGTIFTFSLPLA